MRPYSKLYHPHDWRGWFDFGTGALGDMAIHNMDPAFYALDLGAPTAVEARTSPLKPESYPLWTMLRYEFAAKGDRPAVTLTWYDGGKMPPQPRDLPEGTTLADNGIYFVGDKGTMRLRRLVGAADPLPGEPPQGIPDAPADDPPLDRPPPGMDQGVQGPQAGGRQGGLRLFGPLHRGAAGGQPGPAPPEADRMGRGQHEGFQRPRGRRADPQAISQGVRHRDLIGRWVAETTLPISNPARRILCALADHERSAGAAEVPWIAFRLPPSADKSLRDHRQRWRHRSHQPAATRKGARVCGVFWPGSESGLPRRIER